MLKKLGLSQKASGIYVCYMHDILYILAEKEDTTFSQ